MARPKMKAYGYFTRLPTCNKHIHIKGRPYLEE